MGGPVKKITGGIVGGIGNLIDASMKPFKGLLGYGDEPKMPDAPPGPPTIDDASEAQRAADEARRRRGRAASILTSPTGVGSTPVGTKTLLGA